MARNPSPLLLDRDLDPSPGSPAPLRDPNPADALRLVINPFLAVFGFVLWLRLEDRLLTGPFPPWAAVGSLGLVALPYLIQFHCLDCGRTGPYPRWRRHACDAVRARRDWPDPLTWPGVSPRAQLLFWGYVLAGAGVLQLVVWISSS